MPARDKESSALLVNNLRSTDYELQWLRKDYKVDIRDLVGGSGVGKKGRNNAILLLYYSCGMPSSWKQKTFKRLLLFTLIGLKPWQGILVDTSHLTKTFCFLCSPCPEQGMGDEFNLMDHSDLYILDFSKYYCHFKRVYSFNLESSTLSIYIIKHLYPS